MKLIGVKGRKKVTRKRIFRTKYHAFQKNQLEISCVFITNMMKKYVEIVTQRFFIHSI